MVRHYIILLWYYERAEFPGLKNTKSGSRGHLWLKQLLFIVRQTLLGTWLGLAPSSLGKAFPVQDVPCLHSRREARWAACLFLSPGKRSSLADGGQAWQRSSLLRVAERSPPLLRSQGIFSNKLKFLIIEIVFISTQRQTSGVREGKQNRRQKR